MRRKYDPARTPVQRLLATNVLSTETRSRLETVYPSLDPLGPLHQITILQDALWQMAVFEPPAATPEDVSATPTGVQFSLDACRPAANTANTIRASEVAVPPVSAEQR